MSNKAKQKENSIQKCNKAKQKENSIQKYIQIAQIIAAIVIGILMVKNFNLEVSKSNSLVYSGVDTMEIVTGHKLDRDQQTQEQQAPQEQQATQDQEQQATQDQEQQATQDQEQQATQTQQQEHNNKIHTVLLIQKSLVIIGGLAVIVYLNHSKNNQ